MRAARDRRRAARANLRDRVPHPGSTTPGSKQQLG
jgi:hypothetical protein